MKTKLLLALILILFFATRLYKITEIPPSLYWDEASIGYNAYSITQTGRDEWGDFLPIHFRAFGEFKLPVYIYSVALTQKIIGMNNLSVRLPSVIYWGLAIYLMYLLSLKLLNKKSTALLSAFFLSISPWIFIFSRTGFEASAGVMFFLLAIYLFLQTDRNKWFVIPSILSFLFSIYSYNSFRIVIPITLVVLIYYYFNTLTKKIIPLILGLVILMVGILPIVRLMVFDNGAVRLQTVSVQGETRFETGKLLLVNYLSHFSPDFLFQGDKNPRSQFLHGQIYFLDLLFLTLGIFVALKKRKFFYVFPLIMTIVSPIPATITKESPHALRSILIAPFASIIIALGVSWILENLKKNLTIIFLTVLSIIYLTFFYLYWDGFRELYKFTSTDWQYGYKQIFTEYKEEFKNYDHVFISDKFGQPYIFALYYLKYNPAKFWSEVKLNPVNKWGFSKVVGFDNFIFGDFTVENINAWDLPSGRSLVFAATWAFLKPENIQEKSAVKDLTGMQAFYVYEVQK